MKKHLALFTLFTLLPLITLAQTTTAQQLLQALLPPNAIVPTASNAVTTTAVTTSVTASDAAKATLLQSLYAELQTLEAEIAAIEAAANHCTPLNLTRTLSLGSQGTDVTQLQQFLVTQGDLTATPSGYFGTLTQAAVIKFQTQNGISPVGSVGPITRAKITALTNSCTTTSGGSSSGAPTTPVTTTPPTSTSTAPGTPTTIINYTPPPSGGGGGGGGGSTSGGGTTPPPPPNYGSGLFAQFFQNGTLSIPSGSTPTAAPQITVNSLLNYSLAGANGNDSMLLPAGVIIQNSTNGSSIDVTTLTTQDIASSSVSGITTDTPVGVLQWGTPSIPLSFTAPITLAIAVDPGFNGDTLDVYDSESQNGPWSQTGLATPTCLITNGLCQFQTTSASFFAAAKKKSTVTISANPTTVSYGNSSTITWSSTNATSCTASNGWSGTKATSGTQTFTNLTTNQTYTLTCSNKASSATQSASVTVTGSAPDTTPPSAPTNLAGSATSPTQINLTWTASTDNVGVTGYNIYRAGTLIATSTLTSFSNTGLTASTQYTYTVKAFDAAGNISTASNAVNVTTQTPPVPTVTIAANPTSVTSGGSSTLTWSSTNATACTASGAWSGSKATSGTQSLTNLTATSTYTLTCTGAGGSANQSATIGVTALDTTPPSVTITAPASNLAAGTTQTTLAVTTNENATCAYSTNSGAAFAAMTTFTTTGNTSHSTTLSPLANGTTYTYYVKCKDTAGNISGSASVTFSVATPVDTIPPSVPTNLSASAISSSQINLSWTASTDNVGVTGYKIYRGGTQVGTSPTNSYSDTGLTASTQYTYTVSAYDAAGNNSAQSTGASATTQASGGGGDPTSGVLPSYDDAYANWKNAGLLSVGGIPNRTTVCATLTPSGGDDYTAIQNAINACPAGQVVQLAAGTFNVHVADLPIQINKGIVLRGTGNCSGTTSPYCQSSITVSDGALAYTGGQCGTDTSHEVACPNGGPAVIQMAPVNPDYNYSWAQCGNGGTGTGCGATPLTADAAQGDTTIHVSSTSGFSVGEWVLIDEASGAGWQTDPLQTWDTSGGVWAASDWLSPSGSPATGRVQWSKFMNGGGDLGSGYPYTSGSSGCWHSYCDRVTSELHKIASIGTGTLTLDDPLTIAFRQSGGHNAQVYGPLYNNNSYFGGPSISFLQNAGVENISVDRGTSGGITMEFCAYCWIKNADVGYWFGGGIDIAYSARSELNNVYVHNAADSVNNGGEYPIALDDASTEILITNSITNLAGKGMVARAGGAGSVVSYSYVDDTMYDAESGIGDYWVDMGLNASHYSGPHHVLFEGDWADDLDNDNTHGNSMYMTFFRNDATGLRSPFVDPSTGLTVNDFTGIGSACGTTGPSGCWQNPPGPLRAAGPMAYNYWFSFVGNVLGTAGKTIAANGWTYQGDWSSPRIWMIGWNTGPGGEDPYLDGVKGSYVFRNDNFDYVTNGIADPASGFSQTLPNSLYLSSAPSFFGTQGSCNYPWPWVTPNGSTPLQTNSCGGSGNPAKARWDAGTPLLQTGGGSSGDTTPPSVPTNLSATAQSSSAINLTWTASTDNVGVTGYTIYRNGTQIGTSVTNSYNDSGLNASTQYTYTVAAYDAAGNNSPQSSSASATTQAAAGDTTPPSVPTNFSATAVSSSGINLTWTASTDNVGVTGYKIYRGGTQIGTSGTNSYSDTGLTASTQYAYTVSAYDAAGNNSAQSTSASATTQASGGGGSITIGETTVLPNADSGNANLLIAQNATLSQTATIQSLSFYATVAAGNLRLGIYDATGPNGGPGTLKAQTNSFVTTTGWNTAPVITPVSLPAGTYWLTYLPDNNGLSFVKNSVSGTSGLFYNYAFGPMPATFSTTPQTTGSHWSLYATLSVP